MGASKLQLVPRRQQEEAEEKQRQEQDRMQQEKLAMEFKKKNLLSQLNLDF